MSLSNFFSINLPYGLSKNSKGEWFSFNREYMPLGWTQGKQSIYQDDVYGEFPIYTGYKDSLVDIMSSVIKEDCIVRNEKDDIIKIFLYNDRTNPSYNPEYWNDYFDKLKLLSTLSVK